ncbi:MAG: alcohol dehydrogenase, partial [Sphaerochaetaceae bacterium]|nr:alcohol dehydrogenase [Sphaerochaetaceae bacterium]
LLDLQKKCHVDSLQASDYGASSTKLDDYAQNARSAMSGLFAMDRYTLSFAETKEIINTIFEC